MTISKKIVVSAMILAILAGGATSVASNTTLSDIGTTAIVADAATLSAAKLPSDFTISGSTVTIKWAYDKNWSATDNEYQIKYSLDDGKSYRSAGYASSNGTKGYSKNITLKLDQTARIMIRKSRVTSQKTGTREYGSWTTFYLTRSSLTAEYQITPNAINSASLYSSIVPDGMYSPNVIEVKNKKAVVNPTGSTAGRGSGYTVTAKTPNTSKANVVIETKLDNEKITNNKITHFTIYNKSSKTIETGTKKDIELGVAQHTKNANSVVLYVNPAPGTKSSVRFTLKKGYSLNPDSPVYSGTVSLKLNNKTYKKTLYYVENLSAVKNNTVPTTTVSGKDITATVLVGKTQMRIYGNKTNENGVDSGTWDGKRNNVARTFVLM